MILIFGGAYQGKTDYAGSKFSINKVCDCSEGCEPDFSADCIAGIEGFSGERKWGHNVEESFYAQHQLESLDLNNTLLEEMKTCGSQKTEQELRNEKLLGYVPMTQFSLFDEDKK